MNSTLRIGVQAGPFFDTPVQDGFNLDAFVHDLRSKGYYYNGAAYIPHDAIAFVTLIPAGVTEGGMSMTMPQGQTRQ